MGRPRGLLRVVWFDHLAEFLIVMLSALLSFLTGCGRKPETISLEKAKPILINSATKPEELVGAEGKANAIRRFNSAKSFAELIAISRDPLRP